MNSEAVHPLSDVDIVDLRRKACTTGEPLLDLITSHLESDRLHAVTRLGEALGLRVIAYANLSEYRPAFDILGFSEAVAKKMVLLRCVESGSLLLAQSDPLDVAAQSQIISRVDEPLDLALIHPTEVSTYLSEEERGIKAIDQLDQGSPGVSDNEDAEVQLDLATIGSDSSPAVRTVNSMLFDGVNASASDIHFETTAHGMTIKYRIDGVLLTVTQVSSRNQSEEVVSRIKVLAELDITERRVPQDGKFRVAIKNRPIDVRVSIMPSVFGEDAVLRILDRSAISQRFSRLKLEDLGFLAQDIEQIRQLSREPYGMLLVTGPTGSGKTTTLYAAIGEVNVGNEKIVTIEDPVEYHLDGVLQVPVNEKKGLTFARGLRSILRHDPDKILVGEIRDSETAQIAVQSALTGHAVFTTVHANNALDVVGRVANMGVDPYGFLSSLNGIVAQRLIRKLCADCASPDESSSQRHGPVCGQNRYRVAKGCAQCRGTGYRGRRAIAEIVVVDDELRAAFIRKEPPSEIKRMLAARNVMFLRQQAMLLAAMGETTVDEVNRVTLAA